MNGFDTSRVRAYVDLDAIKHNFGCIKSLVPPGTHIIPVVKADAYGHGAKKLAQLYAGMGAYAFAVAGIDEAVALREAGITLPVMILGAVPPRFAPELIGYDITQTVYSACFADALKEHIPAGRRLKISIKLDTGMKRLGFPCRGADDDIERVCRDALFEVCGIGTHFADSDDPSSDFPSEQLSRYAGAVSRLEARGLRFPLKHAANSAAVMRMPEAYFNAVRPGIILYGSYPSDALEKEFCGKLRHAMTFAANVTHVFALKKGETLGYSRNYTAPRDMTAAVVGAGYADGVPRLLSNRGKVGVNGNLFNIIGNVCMDQFMIDITGFETAVKPFDEAVIFGGGGPSCEQVARLCSTIPYEIYCSVSKRVGRVYL